ncbi:MAG: hypothetical protein MPN21_18585 [Thermoanaerobaculia bacterium]|nr:hypothetical protein [Thermoanaerobaculia bacterium]
MASHLSSTTPGSQGAGDEKAPGPDAQPAGRLRLWAGRLGTAVAAIWATYVVVASGVWLFQHHLSAQRISTPEEIRAYHDHGHSQGLYQYHPTRQVMLRPDNRAQRHGVEGYWMQTDHRGLAYLPPNDGEPSILVLGDSVAFGSWLPYEQSFPGVLRQVTGARVFSGANEAYNLRQTVDLFEEVGGTWDLVVYVWVPNDLYEWIYRETPEAYDPRGGMPRPLDLFDLRDVYLRLTDRWMDPPEGLYYDESLAWNRRRYAEHLRRIERLNRDGNLVVVLTYARPQLDSGRYEPQEWLKQGLTEAGIPFLDTLTAYRPGMFVHEKDNVHFNDQASLEWSEFVIRRLVDANAEEPAG